MSDQYLQALLAEREMIATVDKPDRLAAIDAEIARCGIAVTDDDLSDEAAVAVDEVELAVEVDVAVETAASPKKPRRG